jgi:hypothetical protein
VTVTESGDSTLYDSPTTEAPAGFGQPIDNPDLQAMTAGEDEPGLPSATDLPFETWPTSWFSA